MKCFLSEIEINNAVKRSRSIFCAVYNSFDTNKEKGDYKKTFTHVFYKKKQNSRGQVCDTSTCTGS